MDGERAVRHELAILSPHAGERYPKGKVGSAQMDIQLFLAAPSPSCIGAAHGPEDKPRPSPLTLTTRVGRAPRLDADVRGK
jgi:hypothetical protein